MRGDKAGVGGARRVAKLSSSATFRLMLKTLAVIVANIMLQKWRGFAMKIGYARVSTREQDLSGQLAELKAAGCAKVFHEKASGARGDRAELAKVMKRLQPGDVLVVTRLDRLARSTRDLLNVLASVTERGAGFRSIQDAWADTTTPHGRLMLTV
jgi:DNA invertase Pin-like site-specific DNA recombinase